MKTKTKTWKVPFTKKQIRDWRGHLGRAAGSMLDYHFTIVDYTDDDEVEWREPYEFKDRLRICGAGRGRSAVTFRLRNVDGVEYPMKLSSFTDMVMATDVIGGFVEGRFGMAKQGANYSIVYLGPA